MDSAQDNRARLSLGIPVQDEELHWVNPLRGTIDLLVEN